MPSDIIDYRLIGDDLQAVIVTLDPNGACIAEARGMARPDRAATLSAR